MARRIISKIFLLVFLLAAFQINAQENYIVRDISFEGNDSLSADMLFEQMEHFGTNWFSDVILFEDPYQFSRDIFDKDKIRILRYYQREGFIYAKIDDVDYSIDNDSKTVDINIKINENAFIKVDSVSIKVKDAEQDSVIKIIREKLFLVKGKRFRDNFIGSDRQTIINSFVNNGFPYTEVKHSLDLDTADNSVDIYWEAELGKFAEFGEIKIEGNERTETELIRNKVTFKKGETYDGKELDITQGKIYGLGLFHIVSVTPNFDGEPKSIPVNIKIEEAPQFHTKIGVGYGRDEKFRISLDQKWLGFLGGARQLQFYAKHSALEPYHLRLNFIQPDFLTEDTKLSISPYVLRQTEPGFTIDRLGNDITIQRPLVYEFFGSLKYTFERSSLDTNSISQVELDQYNIEDIYNKSSIELGLERITSRPMFDPSYGSFISVALHYSGLGFNSKYHFFRPSFDYRKYTGINDWLIIAFRIKMSTIFSFDDDKFVPLEERLYSGGSSSNRGWGRAELGPKDSNGKPVGGNSVFESNFELRYPIYSIVSGVAFVDFGNVWKSELTFKTDEFEYAAGLGLRVETPIGPARIDFAMPVSQSSSKVQFFISLGHAF